MKKALLVLVAIIIGVNLNTQAEDFSAVYNGDTIYYNITSSTAPLTVAVTYGFGYSNKYSGEVVIPDSVQYNNNYYKVTSIWEHAFDNCIGLTSITIPNSVTSIGNCAFLNCYSLTTLTIPNSVTSIGNSAFAFSTLRSIIIPSSVTLIEDNTFYYCRALTSVVIPSSVTSIGNYAFKYCQRLTSITIPSSVTSIGDDAFSLCSGLTSVTIPNSVTSIGGGAFYNTPYYNNMSDGVIYINNVLYNYKGTMLDNTIINIQTGTISISPEAFYGCLGLTSITIPNSITSIGREAFFVCRGLTSITIPNSVNSIGESAFSFCSGLTSITCNAINPPSLSFYCFENVSDTIPIYVPCGSLSLYQQDDEWSYFTNFKCDPIGLFDELKLITSTKLYPNPTNNKSKLEVEGLSSDADVIVYDLLGRVIKSYKINPTMKELEIDLSGFAKGVYSVSLKNNDINVSKKLIVQ